MYIRNVKQIIRAADPQFDERRYGFGGLMDLLRAVQKDGFIRMERDRRGGLRVFPGQALQRQAATALPQGDVADEMQDQAPLIPVEPEPEVETEAQPAIDPTAELLGRAGAKPRRTRAKAAPEGGAGKKKRASSSGSSSKRGSRSKRSAAAADEDNVGNQ
jgi:hypothetical protein